MRTIHIPDTQPNDHFNEHLYIAGNYVVSLVANADKTYTVSCTGGAPESVVFTNSQSARLLWGQWTHRAMDDDFACGAMPWEVANAS